MLVRAIALTLAILVGLGVIIPLSTESAEAGPRKHSKQRKYKKYSKKWWRQYRANQKRKKAMQARKRSLRLRQIRLARLRQADPQADRAAAAKSSFKPLPPARDLVNNAAVKSSGPEVKFRVDDSAGSQVGSASITVLGPAGGESVSTGPNKTVGGIAITSLRRDVISKMIQENGWVVNDFQKQIGGREVYVVVAQSQNRNGQVQSRMFYFTELDGRIYSVATNSPADQSERLAEESEKVINSLQNRALPTQRASVKE